MELSKWPKPAQKRKQEKDKLSKEERSAALLENGKRQRQRVLAAVEVMRSNLPGISSNPKLDKANVLDMAARYIMFMRKSGQVTYLDTEYLKKCWVFLPMSLTRIFIY